MYYLIYFHVLFYFRGCSALAMPGAPRVWGGQAQKIAVAAAAEMDSLRNRFGNTLEFIQLIRFWIRFDSMFGLRVQSTTWFESLQSTSFFQTIDFVCFQVVRPNTQGWHQTKYSSLNVKYNVKDACIRCRFLRRWPTERFEGEQSQSIAFDLSTIWWQESQIANRWIEKQTAEGW